MLLCPDCREEIPTDSSCSNCTWEFKNLSNIPHYFKTNISQIIQTYIDSYDTICKDDLEESILPSNYLQYQSNKLLKYLPKNKDARICEVGGGQGYLAKAIKKRGFNSVSVVDIALPYLKNLEPNFNCIMADAENLPFKDHFDVITSTDVMEHVLNLGSYLYSVNQALAENGRFIVRVPYCEDLLQYTPHLGCPYDFVHLRTFSKKTLKKQLNDAGFKIEHVVMDGYWAYAIKKLWRRSGVISAIIARACKLIQNEVFVKNDNLIRIIFCKLFLAPLEICCIARKVKSL
jgi:SAM-dependent methyltransferase